MGKQSFSKETFQTFADHYYEKYEKKKEDTNRRRVSHMSNSSLKNFIQPVDNSIQSFDLSSAIQSNQTPFFKMRSSQALSNSSAMKLYPSNSNLS